MTNPMWNANRVQNEWRCKKQGRTGLVSISIHPLNLYALHCADLLHDSVTQSSVLPERQVVGLERTMYEQRHQLLVAVGRALVKKSTRLSAPLRQYS
jgi:hypothetical protein